MKIAFICWWDLREGEELARVLRTKYETHYVNRENTTWDDYADAIKNADYVFVKGDLHIKRTNNTITIYNPYTNKALPDMSNHRIGKGTKLILVPAGGNYRRKIPGYFKAHASRPMSDYNDYDFIAPINPDLNYPYMGGLYLPMAVDTSKTYNAWKERTPIIITAYNGTYDAKTVAGSLTTMDDNERNKFLVNIKKESPDLYAKVMKNYMDYTQESAPEVAI